MLEPEMVENKRKLKLVFLVKDGRHVGELKKAQTHFKN